MEVVKPAMKNLIGTAKRIVGHINNF